MSFSVNDPQLKSWIPVSVESDFPIQNLPFGVFRRRSGGPPAVGVAIGEMVLDLSVIYEAGLLKPAWSGGENVFACSRLNDFMALGRLVWTEVRRRIGLLLSEGHAELRDNAALRERALVRMSDVQMLLPIEIPNFSDFNSSKYHAINVGSMIRDPQNPLMPNWLHLPVAYHGRASSIIVSGVDFHRPKAQLKPDDSDRPIFAPTRALDFELEMGFIVGQGNPLGTSISTSRIADHIFGLVLVNDWSARDVQKWEYQPLGPFLAKSFATSISPWVVTLEALEPFRVDNIKQDPAVLPYLQCTEKWALDIQLEAWLQSDKMSAPVRITTTNYKHMYWNIAQQLAHQTANGTNTQIGDLYGSGTTSGPTEESSGCMLEITWKGTKPIRLPSGEERKYLEDGDAMILRGWCTGRGYRIGFGEVRAKVLPAR